MEVERKTRSAMALVKTIRKENKGRLAECFKLFLFSSLSFSLPFSRYFFLLPPFCWCSERGLYRDGEDTALTGPKSVAFPSSARSPLHLLWPPSLLDTAAVGTRHFLVVSSSSQSFPFVYCSWWVLSFLINISVPLSMFVMKQVPRDKLVGFHCLSPPSVRAE